MQNGPDPWRGLCLVLRWRVSPKLHDCLWKQSVSLPQDSPSYIIDKQLPAMPLLPRTQTSNISSAFRYYLYQLKFWIASHRNDCSQLAHTGISMKRKWGRSPNWWERYNSACVGGVKQLDPQWALCRSIPGRDAQCHTGPVPPMRRKPPLCPWTFRD